MGFLNDYLGGAKDYLTGRTTMRAGRAIGGLWNDATGVTASRNAARAQMGAADRASSGLNQAYGDARGLEQPYYDMGRQDYGHLRDLVNGGSFDVPNGQYQGPAPFQFNPSDLANDPGYQFRMSQGLQGVQRMATARNGGLGGGTLKALTQYGQGMASNEFGAAYGRQRGAYESDRNFGYGNFMDTQARLRGDAASRYGRLSGLASLGPQTATNLGNQRLGLAGSLADITLQRGNAQAAGIGQGYANQRDLLMGLGGLGARAAGSSAGYRG